MIGNSSHTEDLENIDFTDGKSLYQILKEECAVDIEITTLELFKEIKTYESESFFEDLKNKINKL